MDIGKTMTSSVYVVYKNKVLLHMHKKHRTLFPLGGHIEFDELPHVTALREVKEESGLDVELYIDQDKLCLGRCEHLHRPIHLLLENIGHKVENLDFIYFAKANTDKTSPIIGESKELYWFTRKEIEGMDIKLHVKEMALNALNVLSE